MATAQESSGIIDMKALIGAQHAHAARPALMAAALPAAPRPAPRSTGVIVGVSLATLVIALATGAFALTIPQSRIRGRANPKPAQIVARPEAPPAIVVAPPAAEPVAPVAPAQPIRHPRRPRPCVEPPATTPAVTTTRNPNRPRTLEELMNGAL